MSRIVSEYIIQCIFGCRRMKGMIPLFAETVVEEIVA